MSCHICGRNRKDVLHERPLDRNPGDPLCLDCWKAKHLARVKRNIWADLFRFRPEGEVSNSKAIGRGEARKGERECGSKTLL